MRKPPGRNGGDSPKRENETRKLPVLEEQLLFDIRDHPLDGVVRRYHLRDCRRRGNHAKEQLLERGVIEPVEITTKTGKVVLLDFTAAMKEAMKRNQVPVRHLGRGTRACLLGPDAPKVPCKRTAGKLRSRNRLVATAPWIWRRPGQIENCGRRRLASAVVKHPAAAGVSLRLDLEFQPQR